MRLAQVTAHPIRVQHVFERGLWVRVRVRVRVGVGVALPPNQRGTDQVREMTRRVILARDHEVTVAIDVDRHEALGLASRRLGGRRCVRLALAPLARPNRLRLRLLRMVRVRVRVIRVRVRVRVRLVEIVEAHHAGDHVERAVGKRQLRLRVQVGLVRVRVRG